MVRMNITFSPVRSDELLSLQKSGDTLIINGESFDFSPMSSGDTLPLSAIESDWFAADVEMIDGELVVALLLPNPVNYSPEQAFPVPLQNVADGLIALPQPLTPPPGQAVLTAGKIAGENSGDEQ
jgi:hypothetical protein